MAKKIEVVKGRGRPAIFATGKEVAAVLSAFADGAELSYDHKQRLIEKGYVKAEKSTEPRQTRGRAKMVYSIAGKGRSLLAASKNWK